MGKKKCIIIKAESGNGKSMTAEICADTLDLKIVEKDE